MNLFHRYEGRHVEECWANKPEYLSEAVWSFGRELSFRKRNGHHRGRATGEAFLVGRCNNTHCTARVFVRAGDISAYLLCREAPHDGATRAFTVSTRR